jgi:hypothetical protein
LQSLLNDPQLENAELFRNSVDPRSPSHVNERGLS